MAKNKKGIIIDAVVLLDKPKGISSNAILQKVKRLFNAQKAGHTGSLDPIATGILPICLGQATKLSQFLLNANKRYTFYAQLGATSTTGDIEGEITSINKPLDFSKEQIIQVLSEFTGEISQIPPMYSALKKDGQPLYKLARENITIERQPRNITIFEINFIEYKNNILVCDVLCSKGTYIRTLAEDIAKKLGSGAYLKALQRTEFAHYKLKDAYQFSQLEELKDNNNLMSCLSKTEDMIINFPSLEISNDELREIKFGRTITKDIPDYKWLKLFCANQFIGIAQSTDNIVQPKRLFI
ncbi:tRNA pseudouridine synthase B [hydrothermal vent metagenome]|uniref:tRNA pseudouridine(55) synthase n=1 Tax=hydrothermal vent metagenome TaxID=652676 RepID=A0A1W1CJJ3_9ZZZZ